MGLVRRLALTILNNRSSHRDACVTSKWVHYDSTKHERMELAEVLICPSGAECHGKLALVREDSTIKQSRCTGCNCVLHELVDTEAPCNLIAICDGCHGASG